ncbi:tRNA lysidine(34) synthetase TilS [Peptoniphilus sp.]|uniref:tRNA lysidine(34) synthetase TilS n=1 Tax=Peptoniphilus sp. TaxID=1971214 RepID=UPI0039947434
MYKEFLKTIENNNLIKNGDRVLVGLSGGADSVYLLRALLAIKEEHNLSISAAHINHGIRETAKRDEDFVKDLCDKFSVPLFIDHINMNDIAKKYKITSEEAGRKARYNFFNSIENIDKIALAHNLDDNAETILFRIIRGTGIQGLTGIPINRDKIIRPILNTKRIEIIEELKALNQEYMVDETNLSNDYTRNKIRNLLIPYIEEEFNNKFKDALIRLKDNSIDSLEIINNIKFDFEIDKSLPVENLLNLSKPERFLVYRKYLEKYHSNIDLSQIHFEAIDSLIYLENNSGVDLAGGLRFERHNDELSILKDTYKKCIILKDTFLKMGINKTDFGTFYVSSEEIEDSFSLPKHFLDNLKVRSRKPGDKFKPKGLNGSKKLKDFFNDIKVSPYKRDFVPILLFNDKIIYVVPYRKAEFEETNEKIWIRWEKNERND